MEKQKAIEITQSYYEALRSFLEDDEVIKHCTYPATFILKAFRTVIDIATTKTDWKSIKDEIPNNSDYYLVTLSQRSNPELKEIQVLYGRKRNDGKKSIDWDLDYFDEQRLKITHWMTRPDFPKEEAE